MKDALSAHLRSIGVAARLVIASCIIGLLYYGRVVLIPLALAMLLAFALNPAVRTVMRLRLSRGVSVVLVMTAFILTVTGISWFIGGQLASFARELPNYRANISEKIQDGRALLSGGLIDRLKQTVSGLEPQAATATQGPTTQVKQESDLSEWLASAGAVTDPLTTLGLVILLVALMLLQWSDLRGRLLGLVAGNVSHTTKALADAGERIGRYLFLQLLYNSGFGLVVWLSLGALGVKYAALWGLCAALFRYLPYVGPLFAAALPIFVSLVTTSGWSQVGTVTLLFVVLELVSNNFIEPWLYGSKLGVSEMGIILFTVIWTYLWGAAGLLLATPLTVCLVVLGTYVPCLSFFAKLLGTEQTFSNPHQIYQRLLAGDSVEAAELTQQHVRKHGSAAFISDTLLPALSLARRDHAAGWLANESTHHLIDEVTAVCTELANSDERVTPTQTTELSSASSRPVVIWSACPLTDAVLPALVDELHLPGRLEVVESTRLTGDMLQHYAFQSDRPAAITVLHLHQVDTQRVAGLLKRLSRGLSGVPLQAARLGDERLAPDEKEVFSQAGATESASTLTEMRSWLAAYLAMSVPQAAG